jgi:hypothetical protein
MLDKDNQSDAEWQKHVITILWICFALLIALATAFVYAESHGLFESFTGRTTPLPAWPTGWP